MMSGEIGFEIQMNYPYEDVLERTKEALKKEGFGVLTSINVQTTLKEKLDIDFRPYTILGACNPPLAHRALDQDAVTGLLLPCNVTVEANDETSSIVRIANPEVIFTVGSLEENSEIMEVAHEARERLERVAESLVIA
jgi:uncharacterized protein (DUF302 family)